MSLGPLLLVAGLLAAMAGAIASLRVIQGRRAALSWARAMAYAALVCASLASALLLFFILRQRYDIAYVYQYSSRDLALFYRISAFWAGQQGSFLLWLFLGAIFTVLQIRRSHQFEPYVLLFLLLVQAGLTLFLLVDSPFRPLGRPVADGFGLNPLLQNPWMVAHPPVLFMGYAGLAVPFAYALAGLWRRDYDEWVVRAMPWTLVGWFFLGLGILMGAYWAYETLGWGGYWGWDLVENSSLIPWLTGTGLLHGLLIQRYRQRLRHGNFFLAISTFLFVLYATYLTRSGVLGRISTHSFVESGLTPWMIGLLLTMVAMGVALLATRWTDIPRGPVLAGPSQEKRPLLEGDVAGTVGKGLRSWISRDFTFLLAILALVGMTVPVWVGTLVPLITRLRGSADALDTAFYPRTMAPVLLLMLLVLCLCPLLGWQGSDWKRLLRFLVAPAIGAVLATATALLLGARKPFSLLFILLGAFALTSNVVMVVRTARGGILRLGGYLAHVGLGLLVVGIITSSVYSVDGPRLVLEEGKPGEALGYRFTLVGWQEWPGHHPALRLEVERGGKRFIALPELYQNPQDQSTVATPHVRRTLAYDVYIAAEGYTPAQQGEPTMVGEGGAVPVAGYTLTLRALIPAGSYAQAVLGVTAPGVSTTITPTFPITGTGKAGRPAVLPGGETLSIANIFMPPPGELMLVKGQPMSAGPYTVTMRGFATMHDVSSGATEAGVVVEFAGPAGTTVVTPTLVVSSQGAESRPVPVAPGVTMRLLQMAVEQQAAWVQFEGVELPRQPGAVWVQVQAPGASSGVAQVHVSIKPGMNLLWLGGILLLVGTGVAVVRRWREGLRTATAGR